MSGNQHEALRWLKQAEKDLRSARNSLDSGDLIMSGHVFNRSRVRKRQ
jgi:hypothetical protein